VGGPQTRFGAFRLQKMRHEAEDIVSSEGILPPEPIWMQVASTSSPVDAPDKSLRLFFCCTKETAGTSYYAFVSYRYVPQNPNLVACRIFSHFSVTWVLRLWFACDTWHYRNMFWLIDRLVMPRVGHRSCR